MTPLSPSVPLRRVVGALESRVLDEPWARGDASTVGDVEPGGSGIADTTRMLTLDRVPRSDVLAREDRVPLVR